MQEPGCSGTDQKKLHRSVPGHQVVLARASGPGSIRALAWPEPATAGPRSRAVPPAGACLAHSVLGTLQMNSFISSISISYFFNSFLPLGPIYGACHLPFL